MYTQTLVVGGGIAGMSCANKIKQAGHDVRIVTTELGGRVCYDSELDNNFGAVFFMENYKNARKLLTYTSPLVAQLNQLMLHTSAKKVFKGTSLTMMASLPQLLKFKRFMEKSFMPEYQDYKHDCEHMQVIDAFEKHPQIARYFHMTASELIAELGIDAIADNFISKFAYACTGSRVNELNALDFLNVTQGVVIPIYNFKFDPDEFTARLDGQVNIDSIASIEKTDEGWKATGQSGEEYTCTYLVVATTALTTQKLLDIEEVRQPTMLVSYLVQGKPGRELAGADSHYFSDEFDIIAASKRPDGYWNVFSRTEIDLGDYFDKYEIVKNRVWPEALFTYGSTVQRQDWDENLWVAGDVNGLGLEPAAISGVYAANRILEAMEATA